MRSYLVHLAGRVLNSAEFESPRLQTTTQQTERRFFLQ